MLLNELNYLLLPITTDNPGGDNQEDELLFIDILSARESDPDYLLHDEWAFSEPKQADWDKVFHLCESGLKQKSKDLQLSCWLVEALTHHHHLSGLNHGIAFLSEFIQQFWQQCWPSLDEDGVTRRDSILNRFDRDIAHHLLHIPLLSHPDTSLTHWRNILSFEHRINSNPTNRDTLLKREGDLTLISYAEQAKHFNPDLLQQQRQLISSILQRIAELEHHYLELTSQTDVTLFSQLRQNLNDANEYLLRVGNFLPTTSLKAELGELSTDLEPFDEIQAQVSASSATNRSESAMTQPPPHINYAFCEQIEQHCQEAVVITNRETAVTQMLFIANFFRETEPSSPVPYLMERGARWAMMDLQEWLAEMLSNRESLNEINNVLTGNYD